jgi:periodic tryptophan protein 2
MSFEYSFSNLLGVAFTVGDVCFASKNQLLTPVGHRLSCFDLEEHASRTMAFETKHALRRVAVSSKLIAVCDKRGRGLLVNRLNGSILHRFNLKEHCSSMSFSQDGNSLACAVGRKVEVWRLAEDFKMFSPLTVVDAAL